MNKHVGIKEVLIAKSILVLETPGNDHHCHFSQKTLDCSRTDSFSLLNLSTNEFVIPTGSQT